MPIPKIIHYCWFGNQPIPKILTYCINSWQEKMPDYELKLWNESNIDFDCEFVERAYQDKKWAFVADYVRLKVVYEYGGIYLDTDMLMLEPLDFFLDQQCFFVAEHSKSIGVGVFGAQKNDTFIKRCMKKYHAEDLQFIPIPKIVSDCFVEEYNSPRSFVKDIFLQDLTIYEPEYFYNLPYKKLFDIHHYNKYVTAKTFGIHLWHGSWHSYNELVLLRRKEYTKAFKKILNTVFVKKKLSLSYCLKLGRALRDALITKNAFK